MDIASTYVNVAGAVTCRTLPSSDRLDLGSDATTQSRTNSAL